MINLNLFILAFAILFGCAEQKYFREVPSDEEITLSLRKAYPEDYLIMNVPLKFNLFINSPKIKQVGFFLKLDGRRIQLGEGFMMKGDKSDSFIFGFDDCCSGDKYKNYPKSIRLYFRKKIDKVQAIGLIKKYSPNTSINNIKTEDDTISLGSYQDYKKSSPEFLAEMQKFPDTLIFRIVTGRERKVTLIREKINW